MCVFVCPGIRGSKTKEVERFEISIRVEKGDRGKIERTIEWKKERKKKRMKIKTQTARK